MHHRNSYIPSYSKEDGRNWKSICYNPANSNFVTIATTAIVIAIRLRMKDREELLQ